MASKASYSTEEVSDGKLPVSEGQTLNRNGLHWPNTLKGRDLQGRRSTTEPLKDNESTVKVSEGQLRDRRGL